MITIQLEGVEPLLRRLGVDLKPAMRAATFAIGEELRGKVARYPGPAHRPVIWESRAHQLAYFAERHRRGLPLQYTRNSDPMSQRLGASWTTEHHGDTDAVVGTRVTYARWVQSSESQWQQHKATGWVTDAQAVEQLQRENKMGDIVRDAIEHALERA